MTRTAGTLFALFVFSFLLTGIVGEIVVRLYDSRRIIYDIEMTHYANSMKVNAKDPLINHEHKPNSSAVLMGVPININSDGLRDREHTLDKQGKYRIIFLGDSLTLGWGVEESKTFKHLLESRLNETRPTDILNFGIGNYNTEQELHLFREKGLKYHPDKIVVFAFINDAEKTPTTSPLWWLGYSDAITFFWSRVSAVANAYKKDGDYIHYYKSLYTENNPGWEREKKAFTDLKALCDANRITLEVVLLPELHSVFPYPFTKEHAMLSSYLDSLGIANLDITPEFRNVPNARALWVAPDDAHPNAQAHRMIADFSESFIASATPQP